MKNKHSLWTLICLTVVLWGYIIFRLLIIQPDDRDFAMEKTESEEFPVSTLSKNELPTIELNYPDPYPVRAELKNNLNFELKNKTIEINAPKKVKPIWPEVTYRGRIISQGKAIYLVSINDKQKNMTVGEIDNEVMLYSGFADSIILHFKEDTKIVKR